MRYSEAVKRHKEETKQRILSNILEAAEKEKAAALCTDNDGSEIKVTETNTNEKETITMKETMFNEVSRFRGGAIAAACAALIIGSGAAIYAKSSNIQKDPNVSHVTASTSSSGSSMAAMSSIEADENDTASDTDESISRDESSVDDTSSSADSTSSKKSSSSSSSDTSSKKATTSSSVKDTTSSSADNKTKTTTPDPDVKASFDDLLASADFVIAGQIVSAEPVTITNVDGSTQYCIAYEIYHQYNYLKNTKQLLFVDEWNTTIYQPVAEGTKPALGYNDEAIFMAYDSGSYGMIKTASNGVFAYNNHKLKSVNSGTDSVNNAMTDYILNKVLYGRDRYTVEYWINTIFGADYEWKTVYDDNYPFEATFANWDETQNKYILSENTNPLWDHITHMLIDDEDYYHYFQTEYPTGSEYDPIFVSDCDKFDIALNGMFLNTKSNAVSFDFTIMPKSGDIVLNDGVFYDLKTNPDKILADMGKYFNTDSIIVTKGSKFSLYPDNCISFTVLLYQAEPNGKLKFDLNKEFSITLGGIYNTDGSAIYGSEIKLDFKVDPRILDGVGDEVTVISSANAD